MKTVEGIYEEMKANYAAWSGSVIQEGGDMALRLRAAAAQVYSLWGQAAFLEKQAFPQTAEGEFLDRHAQSRGIVRIPAAASSGAITFFLEEARATVVEIPTGILCATAGGAEFVTTEVGTISAGQLRCTLAATAVRAGAAGNVPAQTVTQMIQPPVGIARCENTEPFTGGRDTEGDASLRQRLLNSYQTLPNGANAAYYESQVLAVPGVLAAEVYPKARGLGTVDIVVASTSGLPTQTLLQEVQARLDAQREICVDIQVKSPVTAALDVELSIAVETGYDGSEVQARVRLAVSDLFSGARLGKGLLLAELGHVAYTVPGVANYRVALPQADVPAKAGVLPVLGSLTVGAM